MTIPSANKFKEYDRMIVQLSSSLEQRDPQSLVFPVVINNYSSMTTTNDWTRASDPREMAHLAQNYFNQLKER